MKAKIEDGNLIITIPLQEPKLSASGKTMVIATSGGNQKVPGLLHNGNDISVGVNAYYSAKAAK